MNLLPRSVAMGIRHAGLPLVEPIEFMREPVRTWSGKRPCQLESITAPIVAEPACRAAHNDGPLRRGQRSRDPRTASSCSRKARAVEGRRRRSPESAESRKSAKLSGQSGRAFRMSSSSAPMIRCRIPTECMRARTPATTIPSPRSRASAAVSEAPIQDLNPVVTAGRGCVNCSTPDTYARSRVRRPCAGSAPMARPAT